MTTQEARTTRQEARTSRLSPGMAAGDGQRPVAPPPTTETRRSFLTTEFYIYLIAVAGVLIASQAVGTNANHFDYFRADRAWLYIVVLTASYLISRGLSKAGSHESRDSR